MFRGKNYKESAKLIDKTIAYEPADAFDLVVKSAKAKFDEALLDPIYADIDAGKYTEKVNADGLWIGDAEVEMRVKAACADAQEEMDRKAREANETTFAYEKFLNNANGDAKDGIEGILSDLDKCI